MKAIEVRLRYLEGEKKSYTIAYDSLQKERNLLQDKYQNEVVDHLKTIQSFKRYISLKFSISPLDDMESHELNTLEQAFK